MPSAQFKKLLADVSKFVEEEAIPAEKVFETQVEDAARRHSSRFAEYAPVMEELKKKARTRGLWNLFFPGSGLSIEQYAAVSEILGRSFLAPEACNCNAPDTGNMEVLEKYGTPAQKKQWLEPLLEGTIRSAFLMTEPEVASSDATNIACSAELDNDSYVVTGRKWWATGAQDPRCRLAVVLVRMRGREASGADWDGRPVHGRHSVLLVPTDSPGFEVLRPLSVFGYDDAPHGHAEVVLRGVRVPAASAVVLGEGRGFEVAQSRLGPGRVHHCMRAIGMAERALEAAVRRSFARTAFGRPLAEHDGVRSAVAHSRMEIDQARLLVLRCARRLGEPAGLKGAIQEVSMIKV
ncbi:unnamed protein product, partial [Phaeothamnion confervicola]